jgi:formate dehydrogenase maturation protein FdhE
MTKKLSEQQLLAIELILEDGMSALATADMVGETPETVEKWLADYHEEQDEKLRFQEAELIVMQKRIDELQEEIAIHRAMYDLIMDRPDPASEKQAKEYWAKMSDKLKHKIVTNAFCIDCGATIITDYVMQGGEEGIILYGKCGKCGKSMATSVEV